ncbi:MAG TPA: energy transducer TonB [Sphingomicrobium sp.]|nr:energy transducer TonB [Sphingomicrobium sp.]
MKRTIAFISALLLGSHAPAAPTSIDLRPSGPWKIDYEQNSCVLSRPYSDGQAAYELQLGFEPIKKDVWLRIASPEKKRSRDDGDAAVEVDGQKLPNPVHFNTYANGRGGTTREFWLKPFNEVRPAQQTLQFAPKGREVLTLHSLNFQSGIGAADSCIDDLHRSLGIDPAVLKKVAVEPDGYMGEFIDLPPFQGEFNFQMLFWVSPTGRVDECHLLVPTGKPSFDKNACAQLMKNGKFKPARDAAGSPIRAPVFESPQIIKTVVRS